MFIRWKNSGFIVAFLKGASTRIALGAVVLLVMSSMGATGLSFLRETGDDFKSGDFNMTQMHDGSVILDKGVSSSEFWRQSSQQLPPISESPMVYDSKNDACVLFVATYDRNETWVYYINNSTWVRKYPSISPPARSYPGMVYDEKAGKVILFGGENLTDTWSYDTATNTWSDLHTEATNIETYRMRMVYDRTADLLVLFALKPFSYGNPYQIVISTCNLTDNKWISKPLLISPIIYDEGYSHFFEIVYDTRNDIFIMALTPSYGFETWTYDLSSNNWTEIAPSVQPSWRTGFSFVFDDTMGVAILQGGFYQYPDQNMTWFYNQQNNTWMTVDSDNAPSYYGFQFTFDTNSGQVILFDTEEVWTFSLANNSWEQKSQCPNGRSELAMVFDSQLGEPIIYGGYIQNSVSEDLWRYDSIRDRWTSLNPLMPPPSRCGHSMTYDEANHETLLYGGWDGTNNQDPKTYNDTWVYNSTSNNWTEEKPTVNPGMRCYFDMVYDSRRGDSLLYGGSVMSTAYGIKSVWTYNISQNNWSKIDSSYDPGIRNEHSMGYDPRNDRIILFGGQLGTDNEILGDTWIYDIDNNTWENKTPPLSPPPRILSKLVYYPPTGTFRLFGGDTGNNLLDDMWDYNLTTNTWTNITPPFRPSPRSGMAVVYDSHRDELIMSAGCIMGDDPYHEGNPSETWILGKSHYRPPGEFTSQPFDTGGSAYFGKFQFDAFVPPGTALKFQLRTATTNYSLHAAAFIGPDGTAGTFYTASNQTISNVHNGDRWLQYRAYFDTTDLNLTAVLDRVTIQYNLRQSIHILSPDEADVWSGLQNITWTAQDPDNDSLSFSIYLENANASVLLVSNLPNGTSGWVWNTSAVPNGTYRIRMVADDNNPSIPLSVTAVSGNFTIFHPPPPPPNHPPHVELRTPLNNSIVNTSSVQLFWLGTDLENEPLTYTIDYASHPFSNGIIFQNATSSEYLDLTNLIDNTTYYWTVDASDGTNDHTDVPAGIWSFTVNLPHPPVNHPPRLTSLPPTEVMVGDELIYNVTATDADDDSLAYSLVASPQNMSIDPNSGRVQWIPSTGDVGNQTVIVQVSDGRGGVDIKTFTVTVIPKPIPPAPEKPQCTIVYPLNGSKVGGRIMIRGMAINGTLPLTIIQVRIDGGDWMTAVGLKNWTLSVNLGQSKNGRHTIEARAFDGSLYSDTASVSFSVVNPEPGVSLGGDQWCLPAIIITVVAGIGVLIMLWKKKRGQIQ